MVLNQDISRCMAAAIGDAGIDEDAFASTVARAGKALATLKDWHDRASLPILRYYERRDDLEACRAAAAHLVRGASDIVLFGTGGSSLGSQALAQLAGHRVPGAAPVSHDGRPLRLHFFDNLDGRSLIEAYRTLDLKTTRFLVVSKSGGTPETVVQMVSALEALTAAGLDWNAAAHMVLLTEPGSPETNVLRRFAARHGLSVLDHDTGVGGRFSGLTNVGMLPALLCGLDPEAIREGAGEVMAPVAAGIAAGDYEPALGAAVNVALAETRGVGTTVMMPYSDRLRLFSAWFQQLWAESLGKDGKGTQPVAAAGPVDQHSQMQLFLGGPPDKLLNIIMTDAAGAGPLIPDSYRSDPLIGYLASRRIGDLVDCQQRATAETYARNRRPVRTFHIAEVNERTMGALMMHFMVETILAGLMLGIDPFDQPAVEQSKVLTRDYLATM